MNVSAWFPSMSWTKLHGWVVGATLFLYLLTPYLDRRNKFGPNPNFTNLWAFILSAFSLFALCSAFWLIKHWLPSAPKDPLAPSFTPPRRVMIAGIALASFAVAVALPATFRAVTHPREVQVFWHDEGITLEQAQEYIEGQREIPDFRITQGWIGYLPVALILKALHLVVPVNYALTNMAYRLMLLAVIFLSVLYTYRLIWQVSHSLLLSVAVSVIAWGRLDFFKISLAIDRPDSFQLLFIVLSLMYLHQFWVQGQSTQWFYAVLFAGLAFASKYAGHLLAPAMLLAWIAHWSKPEVRQAFANHRGYWLSASGWFFLTTIAIPLAAFFLFSPYHLIYLRKIIDFFATFMPIYRTGNVFNLPDHESPDRLSLWWAIFTSRYAFDYWLTVFGLAFSVVALIKNAVALRTRSAQAGEILLFTWGATYAAFLLYQYGLADYRYIMPMQFVLPFFLLVPAVWLTRWLAPQPFPASVLIHVSVLAGCVFFGASRLEDTRGFLTYFRSEESRPDHFAMGRYLDHAAEPGEDPHILAVDLIYVPPRLTQFKIHNVDFTTELLRRERFDYVVTTDYMYAVYADKATRGHETQYDPLYKVHYVDVVDAFTKFKAHAHPDYRHVRTFGVLHLFERIDRSGHDRRASSAN